MHSIKNIFLILLIILFGYAPLSGQNVGINTTNPKESLHIQNGGLLVEGNSLIVGTSSLPDTMILDNSVPLPDTSGSVFDNGGPDGPYNYDEGLTLFAIDMDHLQPLAIKIEIVQMDLAPGDSILIDFQYVIKDGDLGTIIIEGDYARLDFYKSGPETNEGFEIKWNGLFEIETDSIAKEGSGSRLMWIPGKRAIRSGRVVNNRWDLDSIGSYSSAFGYDVLAIGDYSFAAGEKSAARGENSIAMGDQCVAKGRGSVSMGFRNHAISAFGATAIGLDNLATADGSVSIGRTNSASGFFGSIAMGASSDVSGTFGSIAAGNSCDVTGNQGSIALGDNNDVTGSFGSIAIGSGNEVNGEIGSVAIGREADVNGNLGAIAIGNRIAANGRSSITIGKGLGQFSNFNILENNINNSLMIGFLSDVPTLFVGPADSISNSIGKVGIGTITPDIAISNARLGVKDGHIVVSNNFGVFSENGGQSGIGAGFDTSPTDDLDLWAGGVKRATIAANGNVGIGTNAPDTRLHLSGADNNGTTATLKVTSGSQSILMDGNEIDATTSDLLLQHNNSNDVILVTGGGNVGIGTTSPDRELTLLGSTSVFMNIKDDTRELLLGTNSSGVSLRSMTNHDVSFWTNNTRRITIEDTGDVGIGTSNPTARLEVNASTVKKVNGGTWSSTSDARLKKDIRKYEEGLDKVLDINPVYFKYNEKSGYNTTEEHIGIIAQELKEIAPHMVSTFEKDNEKYLQVDNSAMTYMLINAVKELSDRNDQLMENQEKLQQELHAIKELLLKQSDAPFTSDQK